MAAAVDEYRDPNGFKDVSIVIDDSDPERPTLIVHVTSADAAAVAREVEAFLEQRGARTRREPHDDSHVRVIATVE